MTEESARFANVTRGLRISNSDPVTGQAGWYDVRVRIYKAADDEPQITSPQFAGVAPLPGARPALRKWLAYVAGRGEFK